MMQFGPIKDRNGVRFYYFSHENLKSVAVAGTFNGWDNTRSYLEKINRSCWSTAVKIPKGRHLYKIVIDGKAWILDPLNPAVSEDGQNNSSITINEYGDVLITTLDISKENPGYMYKNHQSLKSPEWLKHAVIYQVHLRAFAAGGFKGLKDKIPYLKELGVDTIWMMPFNEIGEEKRIGANGDPYAVKDFYNIDKAFGEKENLKELIRELHKNDMRVIMDWVINRGSIDHVLTKTHPDFFTQKKDGEIYYEIPGRDYFAGFNFENSEMRAYIIKAMQYWIQTFDFDGFRLDDSDLTPHDYLREIRQALMAVKEDIVIISQAYDEYHHIDSCDLTYEGGIRMAIKAIGEGSLTQKDFIKIYDSYKYSFPKDALRMRWLEEKERERAFKYFGEQLVFPATSILLTLDGVPNIMMGEEFNERTYKDWSSLFEDYRLDWENFDESMFEHFKALLKIRKSSPAFCQGEVVFITNSNEKVISYIRGWKAEAYLMVINLADEALEIKFDDNTVVSRIESQLRLKAEKNLDDSSHIDEKNNHLCLEAYETLIYKLKK